MIVKPNQITFSQLQYEQEATQLANEPEIFFYLGSKSLKFDNLPYPNSQLGNQEPSLLS